MTLPHLMLLPGTDGTGELFSPLLAELPLSLRVAVVTYPDRPATYAEHVTAARAELPHAAPFVLLGESFSGPVAVKLAAEGHPFLRGLILSGSFLTSPNPLLRMVRPMIPVANPKLLPRLVRNHAMLGRFATPALRELQSRALSHVSSATLTARLQAMAEIDVREELRRVDLPALYLRGAQDAVVGARFGNEFLATARRGRLVELEAPHLMLQACPRAAADAILEFLGGLTM